MDKLKVKNKKLFTITEVKKDTDCNQCYGSEKRDGYLLSADCLCGVKYRPSNNNTSKNFITSVQYS